MSEEIPLLAFTGCAEAEPEDEALPDRVGEEARWGLFVVTAILRRQHVPQQSDEKERHCDRIDPQK